MGQLIWFCLISSLDLNPICLMSYISLLQNSVEHSNMMYPWCQAQIFDVKQISLIPIETRWVDLILKQFKHGKDRWHHMWIPNTSLTRLSLFSILNQATKLTVGKQKRGCLLWRGWENEVHAIGISEKEMRPPRVLIYSALHTARSILWNRAISSNDMYLAI